LGNSKSFSELQKPVALHNMLGKWQWIQQMLLVKGISVWKRRDQAAAMASIRLWLASIYDRTR
jgi:hypothetical protein